MAAADPLRSSPSARARACKRKFLSFYPGGFFDEDYVVMEREYKWDAHRRWGELLDQATMKRMMRRGDHAELAARAVSIESRTNLLFSFEKMAIRDAVRSDDGARAFAEGLYAWLHGTGPERQKFERWVEVVAALPRKQTRVLTWPVVTVFGSIAKPKIHLFVKPNVTRTAAEAYGYEFPYVSKPNWDTYASILGFARAIRRDFPEMRPRDMIDLQSFIWVQGSSEYD